ncbi:hypothetical protein [Halorhabdus amylolytica]|uniref:hypothetical protein n=1 Tax=Halorhabdus amylolytica TaxID=2559573 RepID=UPI0010AAE283|nr:hypothetical protein [Halorhabdus amylolytica]
MIGEFVTSILNRLTAPTEAATESNGFLSTRPEWHATVIGTAVGVVVAMTGSWELAGLFVFAALGAKLGSKHLGDLRREPWYGLGAFLAAVTVTRYGPIVLDLVTDIVARLL